MLRQLCWGGRTRRGSAGHAHTIPAPQHVTAATNAALFPPTHLPTYLQAYEAMPIEEFGRAMLRGMGWEEGMGVGRNRKQVDAIEYVRRPERLGLGAQPVKVSEDKSKVVKMGGWLGV